MLKISTVILVSIVRILFLSRIGFLKISKNILIKILVLRKYHLLETRILIRIFLLKISITSNKNFIKEIA